MRTYLGAVLLAIPAVLVAQTPLPVGKLTITPPRSIATIDMNKLKGEPARLAWSPDGSQLYLQTVERSGKPDATSRHYVFSVDSGEKKDLQSQPEWVPAYWNVKSAQASPDDPALKIAVSTDQRVQRATGAPMGGDLARGATSTGGDPGGAAGGASTGEAISAAATAQNVTVHSMRLSGQTIGEFVNSVIVPGLTFGWAPKGRQAIAFTSQGSGRVVIMDPRGTKQEVGGTKDAILPAWSQDASHLAWLQKDGKKKFVLQVVQVTP